MATKTIFGCVDWATGKILFEDESCIGTDYEGCINWTTGQVEVIIVEEFCDDTYFGCVNWATGRFQLIIPDDCCFALGEDCEDCPDPNQTPAQVTVTFSGLGNCPCTAWPGGGRVSLSVAGAVNGTNFLLDQASEPGDDCAWSTGWLDGPWGEIEVFVGSSCIVSRGTSELEQIRVRAVRNTATNVFVECVSVEGIDVFTGNTTSMTNCLHNANPSNILICGEPVATSGGTALVQEGDQT